MEEPVADPAAMTLRQRRQEVAALGRSTVKHLRAKHIETFGEATRSGNKEFRFKRIAWRIQSLAEGNLSERARRRAVGIACDADIHFPSPIRLSLRDTLTQLTLSQRLNTMTTGRTTAASSARFVSQPIDLQAVTAIAFQPGQRSSL